MAVHVEERRLQEQCRPRRGSSPWVGRLPRIVDEVAAARTSYTCHDSGTPLNSSWLQNSTTCRVSLCLRFQFTWPCRCPVGTSTNVPLPVFWKSPQANLLIETGVRPFERKRSANEVVMMGEESIPCDSGS